MSEGPLHGIRVLEFSQIVAGPFCGCVLSDMGATVIKVEPLTGDPHRNAAAVVPGSGKRFQSLNRGKHSIALDLHHPEGQALIHRVVRDIDVVTINYRVGVPERLGVDYDTLRQHNPRLIYAELTGFGSSGPMKNRSGTDIVAQAYSGLMVGDGKMDASGAPLPIKSFSAADYLAGLSAATAINAALLHRERTGEGQKVEASLLRAALAVQDYLVMREPVHDAYLRDPMVEDVTAIRAHGGSYREVLAARTARQTRGAALGAYFTAFETNDGGVFALGALTPANRNAARRVMGITDDPTDDPDYDALNEQNVQEAEARRVRIREIIRSRPLAYWLENFEAVGVPVAPVNLPEELSDDPQVEALGIMEELIHPLTGPQRVVGPMVTMSETPTRVHGPAPLLGADTDHILSEAGFDHADIASLRERGILLPRD